MIQSREGWKRPLASSQCNLRTDGISMVTITCPGGKPVTAHTGIDWKLSLPLTTYRLLPLRINPLILSVPVEPHRTRCSPGFVLPSENPTIHSTRLQTTGRQVLLPSRPVCSKCTGALTRITHLKVP